MRRLGRKAEGQLAEGADENPLPQRTQSAQREPLSPNTVTQGENLDWAFEVEILLLGSLLELVQKGE
jgi:hypothetical protein